MQVECKFLPSLETHCSQDTPETPILPADPLPPGLCSAARPRTIRGIPMRPRVVIWAVVRLALVGAFVSLAMLLVSQPAPREQVGPLPNGGFLLSSGWRL